MNDALIGTRAECFFSVFFQHRFDMQGGNHREAMMPLTAIRMKSSCTAAARSLTGSRIWPITRTIIRTSITEPVPHHSIDNRKPPDQASGPDQGRNAPRLHFSAPPRRLLACAVTLGVINLGALAAGVSAAYSQVRVDGQPDTVHVEARDASLQEILAALQEKFNLRYRSNDALDSRMTGTFDGPLRRVAARILDGYDFAMKVTPEGIDVLVMRQNQTVAVATAAPASAGSKAPSAPAMTAAEANRYERGHGR